MATKKTASKSATPTSKSEGVTPKPAAKKAATKKVANKKAAPVVAKVGASAAPAAVKKSPAKPSLDAIARAAYLNYRRRVEQALPGNSQGDWLEAERQFAQQG